MRESLPKTDGKTGKTSKMRLAELLDLPGSIHIQYVRCGRPNCRCASGRRECWHGPHFYYFYRLEGKNRKRYVRRDQVEWIRSICEVRRQTQAQIKREQRQAWNMIRTIRNQLRACAASFPANGPFNEGVA
jgi:hypothetical protein